MAGAMMATAAAITPPQSTSAWETKLWTAIGSAIGLRREKTMYQGIRKEMPGIRCANGMNTASLCYVQREIG